MMLHEGAGGAQDIQRSLAIMNVATSRKVDGAADLLEKLSLQRDKQQPTTTTLSETQTEQTQTIRCWNFACTKTGTADLFKACSRCKKAQYCSRDCQMTDWKEFGHKFICGK